MFCSRRRGYSVTIIHYKIVLVDFALLPVSGINLHQDMYALPSLVTVLSTPDRNLPKDGLLSDIMKKFTDTAISARHQKGGQSKMATRQLS